MLPERPDSKSLRYAEWLPGARAPKKPILIYCGGLIYQGSALLLVATALTGHLAAFEAWFSFLLFWVMIPSFLLIAAGIVVEFRRQKARIPLGEKQPGVVQHPVTVILRREVAYGVDDGLISFVDGWLVYSGRNLNFSVRRGDAKIKEADQTRFKFDGPHGEIEVIVQRPNSKEFQKEWHVWNFQRLLPSGSPTYPPVTSPPFRKPYYGHLASALYALAIGVLTLRVLLWAGFLEITASLLLFAVFRAHNDALRRIAEGKPPRPNGLAAAFRALRSGEPIGSATRRLLARKDSPPLAGAGSKAPKIATNHRKREEEPGHGR